MSPSDPPPLDRVLHARAELLVRHVAGSGLGRMADGLAPLVVVRADRWWELRWLAADLEPEFVAAVVSELDPVAAALVVPERGGTGGVAITMSAAGARALAFTAHPGGFLRRARTVVGPERPLAGRPAQLAAALCRALARAHAERLRAETADA
jgi:hypothetical protein